MYPSHISQTERKIITAIVRKALKIGYSISVFDGEEWAVKRSEKIEVITDNVGATDETTLRFRLQPSNELVGDIFLVHGNDEDVVSDMTDNAAMQFLTTGA